MNRIRTVKPSFFTHYELFKAEQDYNLPLRIAYEGLWTVADREGRFKWKPYDIKPSVLPHDQVDFSRVLTALEDRGFIVSYEVDGEMFGYIPTFLEHQVINTREAKSKIPAPDKEAHVRAREKHVHAPDMFEHTPNGVNIPAPMRAKILQRDGHQCRRCSSTNDLTIDHIFPRSVGGTHVETNLRVLCRSCNSARPVSGPALDSDLERDGFTWDDMERTCTHVTKPVHAQGEGKGREGKGRDSPPPPSRTVSDASGTAGGDLITGLADEIWAMAGQTKIADGKRAGGFIDDYRLVKGWLDGGHTPEAIRSAAKATIDSSGDIRSLWGLLAKAVPARLTEGAARSGGGEYGYDPASAHKELYARCVVFFMMGKWRERMASGKVIGPAPYTEGCLVPPEIIAAAKMDPKVIAAHAQKATA